MKPGLAPPEHRIVLYIDSLKTGGAERAILTFARWLQEEGFHPLVLTRKPASWDFYPIPAGVTRVVEPAEPFWMQWLGWLAFPFRIIRLQSFLRHHRAALTLGMTTLPAIKLLLACRIQRSICVVSERNYPPAKKLSFLWRMLRRVTYPWADLHLVQSRATGRWLLSNLAVKRQILLPNPVQWPLARFEPNVKPELWLSSRGVDDEAILMLAVGTKLFQKGFDILVKAFSELASRHSALQLIIVGLESTPYHGINQQHELLRMLADQPAAGARLHFPGRVGNLADWYAIADLFVLPSRYEGFPNVLLEAMSAGCPCVASDCLTGPSDLIRHGHDGLLLPAESSSSDWAEALDQLLRDPERRQELAQHAVDTRRRFSEECVKQQFVDAMLGLIHTAA